MTHQPDPLSHAEQTARDWLAVIADRLGSDDRHFTYRALRAWLHLVRDRLTVESAAHLAAQLPEFLRGMFYDGWKPNRVPIRFDARTFAQRFAREAAISQGDVPAVAGAISDGLSALFSPGQLDHVFALMPSSLRGELQGEELRTTAPAPRSSGEHVRINALEDSVMALTEAVSALARGLENVPTNEPQGDRAAKAAQEAHRILMSQGTPQT
ncbi:DUF2267 domain-containing protein [Amycolatopsis rhizosphaerae]|uniref:DUF2267 domain-containing protein n=1 Tax=Amycolatopsis rhizosphaerae TaxID=2053003 RepID=A0A558DBV0_9PSEU|nr:DUF2267 domain-containing protein [Amycolatopsis rhizosphaerae]TVT58456.1 DUF2267 domain-containing protein [Amycolatopsis rhizosphaerae]